MAAGRLGRSHLPVSTHPEGDMAGSIMPVSLPFWIRLLESGIIVMCLMMDVGAGDPQDDDAVLQWAGGEG